MSRQARWTPAEAITLGTRLRVLREEAGLSQRDLVADTSVTAAYLSRIETGNRYPTLDVLREFAARLGVSPEYLERGDDDGVIASVRADQIDAAAERWGVSIRWADLRAHERAQVTQGLDEALLDSLAGRLHAFSLSRETAGTR